jgi:hypothetical protein
MDQPSIPPSTALLILYHLVRAVLSVLWMTLRWALGVLAMSIALWMASLLPLSLASLCVGMGLRFFRAVPVNSLQVLTKPLAE